MTFPIRWPRLAVGVWSALIVTMVALTLLKPHAHTVYPIYKFAAERWREQRPFYEAVPGYDFYRYSPLIAATFVPFSFLPDGIAGALWRLVNVGVFLFALGRWCRYAAPRPLSVDERAKLFLGTVPLALGSLHNGQANVLVAGLMLLATTGCLTGSALLAAFAVAVATYFKVYPLALGLLMVLLFPRRLAAPLVLAMVALGVAPFLVGKPNYVAAMGVDWWEHISGDDRQELLLRYGYRDFHMLWRVYVGPMPLKVFRVVEMAVGGLLALFALWGQQRGWATRALLFRIGGLAACWMTAFGPATESCTYTLMAPALATALVLWADRSWSWRGPLWLSALLLNGTVLAGAFPDDWRVQILGPQPLGVLILAGVYIADGIADHPATAAVALGRFNRRAA